VSACPAPCPAVAVAVLAAIDDAELAPLIVHHALEATRRGHATEIHFVRVRPFRRGDAEREAGHAELEEWIAAAVRGESPPSRHVQLVAHSSTPDSAASRR
jgi:hypothetical protein